MSEIITTLHPENNPQDNLYPNIKNENIPDDSVTIEKIAFYSKTNNLLDPNKLIIGAIPNGSTTGNIITSLIGYRVSDFIPVVENHTYIYLQNYIMLKFFNVALFDNEKNFISMVYQDLSSYTPNISGFIRITFSNNFPNDISRFVDVNDVEINRNRTFNGNLLLNNSIEADKIKSVTLDKIYNYTPIQSNPYNYGSHALSTKLDDFNYNVKRVNGSGYEGGGLGFYIPSYFNDDLYISVKITNNEGSSVNTLQVYIASPLKGLGAITLNTIKNIHLTNNELLDYKGTNFYLFFTSNVDFDVNVEVIINNVGFNDLKYVDTLNKLKPYENKKVLFLGDSITALGTGERGWVGYFNSKLNITNFINVAVNSATLCDRNTTDPYDGNPTQSGSGNNNTIGNQVQKVINNKGVNSDYDDFNIIIISASTNDSTPLNSDIDENQYNIDLSLVDRTTYSGAIRYIYTKLQDLYPNSSIYFATPIQSKSTSRSYLNQKLKGETIKNNCNRLSIKSIDTFECGICDLFELNNSNGRDLIDGLHPNINGAKKIANYNSTFIINNYK